MELPQLYSFLSFLEFIRPGKHTSPWQGLVQNCAVNLQKNSLAWTPSGSRNCIIICCAMTGCTCYSNIVVSTTDLLAESMKWPALPEMTSSPWNGQLSPLLIVLTKQKTHASSLLITLLAQDRKSLYIYCIKIFLFLGWCPWSWIWLDIHSKMSRIKYTSGSAYCHSYFSMVMVETWLEI